MALPPLTRAELRADARLVRTRQEYWQDQADTAFRRGRDAAAAGDLADALRWMDRAGRIVPDDPALALSRATLLLRLGEVAEAGLAFAAPALATNVEALAGIVACRRAWGDRDGAAALLATTLGRHALTPALRVLAETLAAELGLAGWCGQTRGVLHAGAATPPVTDMAGRKLALAWADGRATLPPGPWLAPLELTVGGRALLGSPLHPALLQRTEGAVEARDGGIVGWAWLPADPTRDPGLTLVLAGGTVPLAPEGEAPGQPAGSLGRARAILVPAAVLAGEAGPVRVLGEDGRDLLGSPLDPGGPTRAARALAQARGGVGGGAAPDRDMLAWLPSPVGPRPATPAVLRRGPRADVVVPVHGGGQVVRDCLDSVLTTLPSGSRLHVVDDASPDPVLVAHLQDLAARGHIRLIRLARNLGFPGAANAGLRACAGRDAVLLNSDTLVPRHWLERLRDAAWSAPDIGSVTPLSNDATICSVPAPGSPPPDLAGLRVLDGLAVRANAGLLVDIPTPVGFCMLIRRDCLAATGLLREDAFAQGYGEENDWAMRARALGWRHVAAAGLFVAHCGGTSFGPARQHLIRRNMAVLEALHPGYLALVERFGAEDPLRPARRRMGELAMRPQAAQASVVLVTHSEGGGVDRVVRARLAAARAASLRPLLLRPDGEDCTVSETMDASPGDLRYRLPEEWPALLRLLRRLRPARVELHHLQGHVPELAGLAARLGVEQEVWVHDYALFCPRVALVSHGARYCGEPDLAGCEACIADLGGRLAEDIAPTALVARSAALLQQAEVIAPTRDSAARIARHFPGVVPTVRAWEPEHQAAPATVSHPTRILVPGAIGVEKGLDVLVACLRDARARRLPLEFVVVGYTADDSRVMAAGPCFITGSFRPEDGVALMRAQGAALAFLPSVWPETWCFALSDAWAAGLPAVVFDLGGQAERVRGSGRGWALPLGLPAPAVNDALLRLCTLAAASPAQHCAGG